MKTIQVTDEMYDFLSNLSHEIKTQNNAGTRFPYFIQVQEDEEVAVPDGCGEEVWVCDGEILRTDEDIKYAVFEFKNWELGNKEHEDKFKELSYGDIKEIIMENYRLDYVSTRHKYSNCFLTLKACKEHISCNGHNLNNPGSYIFHAYRNNEMDMIFRFLLESF